MLASKDRQLVYNGPVKLMDKRSSRDAVAFLFTDSLLLTQQKSSQTEKKNVKKEVCTVKLGDLSKEIGFVMFFRPLAYLS